MSVNGNNRKDVLLGEPHGTAAHKLRKAIIFKYVQMMEHDTCYRCSKKIESIDDLSIEHKTAWQSAPDPRAAFFDLSDIVFSHLKCNSAAAFQPRKKYFTAEDKRLAHNRSKNASKKRHYSPEKRRREWLEKGW